MDHDATIDDTSDENGRREALGGGNFNRRRLLGYGAGLLGLPALTALAGAPGASADTTASAVAADPTKILRFGAMRGTSYDPIRVGTQTEYPQLNAIFDTLVTVDPVSGEIGERLATAWEVMDDRVRFTLRDGVTFQDGTPFDADAVKFSVDRALTDPESNITTRLPMVAGVEVVDPTTVDFVLSLAQPIPLLLQLADRPGMIVSPAAVDAAGGSEAFSAAPIGAGMYKVEGQWFPRESMSVRAWDGYWDPDAARLGGIDYTEVAMSAQLNALRAGEVDMGSYQGADAQAIEGQPNLRLKVGYTPLIKGLVVNINQAPFDDIKVRQAIAYAINREAAVQALTFGYGRPAYQMFAQESAGYDPELEGSYAYDVDKAKALLAEAGYPDGVSFDSIIGSTAAPYVQFGQFLQANLNEAGIEMNLELVDASTVIGRLYGEFTTPSAPIATSGGVADTTIRLSLLDDGPLNPGKIEVPGVRELVDQAASATSQDEANEHYRAISRIQVEGLYAIIPVFNEPALTGYEEYVGGITRGMADTDVSPEMFRGIYITEGGVAAD